MRHSIAAKDKTLAALAGLKPGFTGADLVSALNLSIINFETGSAAISPESRDLLTKAATTMKQLPAGTVIEISGHTDSTGDPAANLTLSQQRADAVRTTLINLGVPADMLKAKGYGDTNRSPATTRRKAGSRTAASRTRSFSDLDLRGAANRLPACGPG